MATATGQRGAALLIFILAMLLGLSYLMVVGLPLSSQELARQKQTVDALSIARDTLVGKAISERNDAVFGLLPTPDLGSTRNATPEEGVSAGSFAGNTKNLSVLGRLPWRTLGLPPLRDSDGECLWYAVSGAAQTSSPPDVFNWDTIGHFEVFSSNGTAAGTAGTMGSNPHDRALALVIAPGAALASQDRSAGADLTAQCGGNYNAAAYLDPTAALSDVSAIQNFFTGTPPSINGSSGYAYNLTATSDNSLLDALQLAAPKKFLSGQVDGSSSATRIANDRIVAITPRDIFDKVKKRSDFKTDLDTWLNGLADYLNALPVASLPTASASNKGIDNVIAGYLASFPSKQIFSKHWKDNLLYAPLSPAGTVITEAPPSAATTSTSGCNAVLIFAGERTQRTVAPLTAQLRATAADKQDAGNYLENANAALFPASGTYTGLAAFDRNYASRDIVRCIKGAGAGTTQVSFASDLASFQQAGAVSSIATDPDTGTLTLTDASGTAGACLWYPSAIPLAGKVIRSYFTFRFLNADAYALTSSGSDRGNGFTLQMVRSDLGGPNRCGSENNMGALGSADMWGSQSFITEIDVHRDFSRGDPTSNHVAILTNGSLTHPSGSVTAACDGSAAGCALAPANDFEESPPLPHTQRLEIHSGCNATCSSCNPAAHASPNTYVRVTGWTDCATCSDTAADLDRTLTPPTMQRCINLASSLNSVYFGLTGGFRSSTSTVQGVTVSDFILRSE